MTITRRDFLTKLVPLALSIGTLTYFKLKYPRLTDKIMHSIEEGKALEDISEIVESRFPNYQIEHLGPETTAKKEAWIEKTCNSSHIYDLQDNPREKVGFFDVTTTTQVIPIPGFEITDFVDPYNPDLVYDIAYYSREAALRKKPYLTLPLPQQEAPVSNDQNKANLYHIFSLHSALQDSNDELQPFATNQEHHNRARGGLVLFRNGTCMVLDDVETNHALENKKDILCVQEYAFFMDSSNLNANLNALQNATFYDGSPSFKAVAYSDEYTSMLCTFYREDGSFSTQIVSLLNKIDENNPQTFQGQPGIKTRNVLQFLTFIQDYASSQKYTRYVAVLPDPSLASTCFTPLHCDPTTDHRERDVAEQIEKRFGIPKVARRVIGHEYTSYEDGGMTTPFMLGSTR